MDLAQPPGHIQCAAEWPCSSNGNEGASSKNAILSAVSSLGRWARMLSENRMASVSKADEKTKIVLSENIAPFVIGSYYHRGFFAADEVLDWVFSLPWSRIITPPRASGPEKRYLVSLEVDRESLLLMTGKQIPGISIDFFIDGQTRKAIAAQFALDIKVFYDDDKSISKTTFGRIPVDVKSASKRSLKAKKKT